MQIPPSFSADPRVLTVHYMQNQISAQELYDLEERFLNSYLSRDPAVSDREWLLHALGTHLPDLTYAEISTMCDDILGSFDQYSRHLEQVKDGVSQGLTPQQWLQARTQSLGLEHHCPPAAALPGPACPGAELTMAGDGDAVLTAADAEEGQDARLGLLRSYLEGLRHGIRTARSHLSPRRLLTRQALNRGLDSGIKAALAAALQVALKRGLIKSPVPLGSNTLGIIAMMSVEHAKVGYQLARGRITRAEAVSSMGVISTAGMATAITSSAGAAIGVAMGSIFPIGGQFIGGMLGGIAGELLGQRYGDEVAARLRGLFSGVTAPLKSAASRLTQSVHITGMKPGSVAAVTGTLKLAASRLTQSMNIMAMERRPGRSITRGDTGSD